MGKKSRLSRDQKRKAKLVKEAKRARQHQSLAYEGNKYKTDELVPVFLATETGIYESYVMTDGQLTDRDVEAALERLILQMRAGPLPPFTESFQQGEGEEGEQDLITWNIRRNWQQLFETERHPGAEKLMGVLRTLLSSIKVWSTPHPDSRGYLRYLKGFLRQAGVSVEPLSPEDEPPSDPEEDDLFAAGQAWCQDDDPVAAADFRQLAERMMRSGKAEIVAEVCQELLNEARGPAVSAELSALSLMAQHKMTGGRG
jgi:hypothetical protein